MLRASPKNAGDFVVLPVIASLLETAFPSNALGGQLSQKLVERAHLKSRSERQQITVRLNMNPHSLTNNKYGPEYIKVLQKGKLLSGGVVEASWHHY